MYVCKLLLRFLFKCGELYDEFAVGIYRLSTISSQEFAFRTVNPVLYIFFFFILRRLQLFTDGRKIFRGRTYTALYGFFKLHKELERKVGKFKHMKLEVMQPKIKNKFELSALE